MESGRGMKKKIKSEPIESSVYDFQSEDEPKPSKKQKKMTDCFKQQRKRMNRFDGLTDEEVMKRTLPDHLAYGLEILIVGINPGLFAAYKGHHYAGPGNHFWKCMYLAELIPEPMTAVDDYKLLQMGIGFTNMVTRATKGSADLSKKELRDGAGLLLTKLRSYQPKIAAFNGKLIYEAFTGKKKFGFGLQADPVEGTNIKAFVMPSSSARCAQLPRATDKVPYYNALKRYRDHLRGELPDLDLTQVSFPDVKLKQEIKREAPEVENGDTRGSNGSNYYDGASPASSEQPPLVSTKKKYAKKKVPIYSQPAAPLAPPPLVPEPPEAQQYESASGGASSSDLISHEEDFLPYSMAPPLAPQQQIHDAQVDINDPYSQVSSYPFPPTHHVVSPYFSTPPPPPVTTCNGSFASLTPVSPELLAPSPHHPMYSFQSPLGWGCDNGMLQSQPPLYGQQFLGSPTGMDRLLSLTEIKQERPD